MVFENGVKNIQAATYNGACTEFKMAMAIAFLCKNAAEAI
jgi:hypothetical protein